MPLLPEPTGKHSVAAVDVVTKTGLDGSLFRLYYPTEPFKPTTDICPLWVEAPEYINHMASWLKKGWLAGPVRWMLGGKRIPVLMNGPLKMPEGVSKLPVVIFSHGLGLSRWTYCYIAYELASHGFLVAAIEHKDRSAVTTFHLEEEDGEGSGEKGPKKYVKKWTGYQQVIIETPEEKELRVKQVYERANECSQLLDYMEKLNGGTLTNIYGKSDFSSFKDKLDLEKCTIMGHSFGGSTVISSLAKEPRFKVGVALDVWMFPLDDAIYKTRIEQPILFINSDSYQTKKEVSLIPKLDADVHGVETERKLTTLLGAVHMTQSDFTYLVQTSWIAQKIYLRGPSDPKSSNDVNSKLMLSFIGKHLDLTCGGEVDDVVKENPQLVMDGTNIELDEEEVEKAKEELRAELQDDNNI